MADPFDVLQETRDALGIEPYRIYPRSRRLIPEAVLWGFASACILEFVKGLVDFKKLGEASRAKVEQCLRAWRAPETFEQLVADSPPDALATSALALLPASLDEAAITRATQDLSAALQGFGIPSTAAAECADRIAKAVKTYAGDAPAP